MCLPSKVCLLFEVLRKTLFKRHLGPAPVPWAPQEAPGTCPCPVAPPEEPHPLLMAPHALSELYHVLCALENISVLYVLCHMLYQRTYLSDFLRCHSSVLASYTL